MKIAFVCSCIEPGRDGVGDYARELAVALIRHGHEVRLLGLAERFCSAAGEGSQKSGGLPLPVLRLPEAVPWAERLAQARSWLDSFQPDWLSLQFVIYGYSRKGLPWRIAHRLGALCGGWRVHLMMHETWIGFMPGSPWRQRLIGAVQRRMVAGLVRRLRPALVHTTIPLYQLQLTDEGVRVALLPLFTNIPVAETDGAWLRGELAKLGLAEARRAEWFLLGVFGSFHPRWPLAPAVRLGLAEADKTGKRLAFMGIGRAGSVRDAMLKELRREFGERVLVHHFGEQPPARVSEFLRSLDAGVATLPVEFNGKSSAVATLRAHGVRVWSPHSLGLAGFAARLEKAGAAGGHAPAGVGEVADKFLSDLAGSVTISP
jgi:hypothetical protein